MDLLFHGAILFLHLKISSTQVYTGVLTRLWPLDRQTCSSEVLTTTYVYGECKNTFNDQPQDFPFNAMEFDGSSSIDVAVDVSTTNIKHYSFQGWFFFTSDTSSSLFHYRDGNEFSETIVWTNKMKLKLYRKVDSAWNTFTGSQQISKYRWYYIALGVGQDGYVSVRIDGVKDIYGMLTNRQSTELPGTLRIGGDFGEAHANVEGRITCVGFHLNTRNASANVVKDVCTETAWMPERGSNSIYLTRMDKTALVPVYLKEVTRCSISECAHSCLEDIECFYISFDGESATCNSCYLFKREDTTGNNSTLSLYKVRT
ncbi:uncharacterized protein LOC134726800 [Mytilus trossulus]|uniref:uncharacterized protein LOC134726800 n=1 Tax=Mytilus trossulus TaxID=6551 RepID=UPI0030042AF8